jgi:signal transduction histidine kinase
MNLQDEERRRIARELHDTAGQTLAAIKMTAAALDHIGKSLPGVTSLVGDLNGFTDEALRQIRTTSYLLHPPLLDEAGIASAARWFVEGFAKRSGIQVDYEIPARLDSVSRNCEMALFRILQESLTNVHRHSRASAATVRLSVDDDSVRLEIKDNGEGITEGHLQQLRASGNGGVGIAGMRERVRELGGEFAIESNPDGTTLIATVPLVRAGRSLSARSTTAL